MGSWELYLDNAQTEPHDEAHVLRMIAAGLPANTLVRQVGEAEWRGLKTHAPFAAALASRGGEPAASSPQPQPVKAAPITKSSFIGAGCLVQGLGFFAPAVGFMLGGFVGGAVGMIAFLVLLLVGSRMSRYLVCGVCGNRLTAEARMCAACKATVL